MPLFIIKNNKFVATYNQDRKATSFLQFLNKYVSKATKNHTKILASNNVTIHPKIYNN